MAEAKAVQETASSEKQDANGKTSLSKRASPPTAEAEKERTSGEDSEATVHSTSDDNSPATPRYGLRRKRSKASKASSPAEDTKDGNSKEDDSLPNSSKHRRKRSQRSGKDGDKPDGLLRLAQIANASPREPKKARGDKAQADALPPQPQADATAEPTETEAPLPAAPVSAAPADQPIQDPTAQIAATQAVIQQRQGVDVNAIATGEAPLPEQQYEQKITPAQIRAWVTSGQTLDLPGFQPQLLPVVHLGARWQLDLRTGERLEDQPAPQMSLAMQGQMGGIALAQALGPRPPIFTGLNQSGQVPGSMTYVPPPSSYGGSLPIPSLGGQQGIPSGGPPAGPYTALLGPQMHMQSLLQPGVMQGQYHPGFAHLPPGSEADGQQSSGAQPKKRQRSSAASELADLPDIPLRRRGRPAGDGTSAVASPHELQERRMQANRAAASRSHFRRKREMELLDKDCATAETRAEELRASLANLMAQEEQLRLQQASIRDHLAAGCKPDPSAGSEAQEANPDPVNPQSLQDA